MLALMRRFVLRVSFVTSNERLKRQIFTTHLFNRKSVSHLLTSELVRFNATISKTELKPRPFVNIQGFNDITSDKNYSLKYIMYSFLFDFILIYAFLLHSFADSFNSLIRYVLRECQMQKINNKIELNNKEVSNFVAHKLKILINKLDELLTPSTLLPSNSLDNSLSPLNTQLSLSADDNSPNFLIGILSIASYDLIKRDKEMYEKVFFT